MDKNNKDIRKEIEELEKLIEKVKKQNEEEKQKQKKKTQIKVVKINLAQTYANNFWINMVFSFLINFIVIFGVLKLFDFVTVTNDIYIFYVVLIFTIIEEFYKKYLLNKQIKVVLYTSGLIFSFINIIVFYFLDLFIFGSSFSFNNYLYPVSFVVLFQVFRAIIKNIYIRIIHKRTFSKTKKR